MALITRFTRLFRADMHAVLDRLEEPDLLLRQAIREMEDAVGEAGRRLKLHALERTQAEDRLRALEAARGKIAEELDLCFDAGNETLARTLLRRRLENERLSRHLQQRQIQLSKLIAEQTAQLDEQRHRLEGMRQKAAAFEAEPRPSDPAACPDADDFSVSDADVELAWLREQQQRRSS